MLSLQTNLQKNTIRDNKILRGIEKHRCENCFAVYAEYVNGCPKCATGEVGGSHKVRPDRINIADVIDSRRTLFSRDYNLVVNEIFKMYLKGKLLKEIEAYILSNLK